MAVAYDTASATQTISNVSTIPTINHTASGSDRYVRFSAGWAKLGTATLTATYGGNAMTAVGEAVAAASWGSGVTGRAKIFGYIAPSTSSEAVVGTFTAAGTYGACGVVSYTGVDQTTPDGAAVSATGFSNAPSVTVTDATTGDMVSDALATEGGASLTAGQTQRFSANSSGYRGAGQDAAGSGSVAMGWSLPSSVNWAQVAAAIFQASGGGATNLTVPDSSHAHTLDNVVLTSSTTLAVQDMVHGHALDAPTLSTGTALTVDDSAHAHALDAVALTSQSSLAADDMAHAHALDNATLTLDGANLTASDIAYAHALDGAALTLDTFLAVDDAVHGHALDGIVLTPSGTDADTSLGGRAKPHRPRARFQDYDVPMPAEVLTSTIPQDTPPTGIKPVPTVSKLGPASKLARPAKVKAPAAPKVQPPTPVSTPEPQEAPAVATAPAAPAVAPVPAAVKPARALALADILSAQDLTHDELLQAVKLLARELQDGPTLRLVRSHRIALRR